MRYFIICVSLLIICSCSHYDWSATNSGFVGSAPIVSAGQDIVINDATSPVDLHVSISDPNTPISNLQITWIGNPGNPALVSIDTSAIPHRALFPRNGTYVLTMSVSDGSNIGQDNVVVTVNDPNHFSFAGTVKDNLIDSAGVSVDLLFNDGTVIETVQSDINGSYRFNNLIGSLDFYTIQVN